MASDPALKERARSLREAGYSYRAIALLIGVAPNTIRRWVMPAAKQAHAARNAAYQSKRWSNSEKYREQTRKHGRNQSQTERYRARKAAYVKERRANDIQFKLANSLRIRLCGAIAYGQKAGSAVSDLGCSIDSLKHHLEQQFQPGMTWQNHGEWHIDHKKPLSTFDLTDRVQFLQASHYTNLQPLWAVDNLRKSNKCLESERPNCL